jgi:hypothetical protein
MKDYTGGVNHNYNGFDKIVDAILEIKEENFRNILARDN